MDKSGQKEGVDLAVSGYSFSVVSLREKRKFEGQFINIFLSLRLQNKEENKRQLEHAFLFNEFLFFYSFCSPIFVFQLSVHADRGGGAAKQKRTGVDGDGREAETGKMCGNHLQMTPYLNDALL